MSSVSSSTFVDSKKHLLILDGLRGIAAIMVLIMHTFEMFCGGDYRKMLINHGYLAAAALYYAAIMGESGDLIGGWSLEPKQLKLGFTRLLFPYMAGMLLRRI